MLRRIRDVVDEWSIDPGHKEPRTRDWTPAGVRTPLPATVGVPLVRCHAARSEGSEGAGRSPLILYGGVSSGRLPAGPSGLAGWDRKGKNRRLIGGNFAASIQVVNSVDRTQSVKRLSG